MPSHSAKFNLLVAFFRRLPLNHSLDFPSRRLLFAPLPEAFSLIRIFALATLRRLTYRDPSKPQDLNMWAPYSITL